MLTKKSLCVFLLCVLHAFIVRAQKPVVDSLKRAYQNDHQDTTLVKLLDVKSVIVFGGTNTDSAMICARRGLAISRRIHYAYGEVRSLANIALYLNIMGDLPGALRISYEVLPKAIAVNENYTVAECYSTLGTAYYTLKDFKKSNACYHKALPYVLKTGIYETVFTINQNLCRNFFETNRLDSALWYANKLFAMATERHLVRNIAFAIRNYGLIQFKKGNYAKAIDYYNKALAQKASNNNHNFMSESFRLKAEAFQKLGNLDSCITVAQQGYREAELERNPRLKVAITTLLASAYQSRNDYRQAYYYQQLMLNAKDSLFNQQKALQIENVEFNEQQRQEEIRKAQADYQNRIRFYGLLTVIGVFALIAGFLLYNNRARTKANALLHAQNGQIQSTLTELKNTQTQLIQSAKMASLGELTAGIAHEIQNPLNFVNNFSEVSAEMMSDLKEELQKGDVEEAMSIAGEVEENLGKINHHGKRADGIVKGMLEHSRVSSGQKEPADLNKLADEYLRLAYHGIRAKDQTFNADLITQFDNTLPRVEVVAQDIGRVLLNLVNNAFYATQQKAKTLGTAYRPAVEIQTLKRDGYIFINITDNGIGIPDAIKDKIMQPFFTTKPTGEGTGLGLSLSYDIVVQGHNGKIDVVSTAGEGATFTIALPAPTKKGVYPV